MDSNNDALKKSIAILTIAKELKLNETYRIKWQKGFATCMAHTLGQNNLPVEDPVIKAAYEAAGMFIQNIIDAVEFPEHGWIYDFNKA